MKWFRAKIMKLIRGIDSKIRGTELLDYNKNSDKASKIKRRLQLIVRLDANSLGNMGQHRRHCIKPSNECYPPRNCQNPDIKPKLDDI